jgi:V8-like Glu-specific endopeptidase
MTTLRWFRRSSKYKALATGFGLLLLGLVVCEKNRAQAIAPVVGETQSRLVSLRVANDPSGVLWSVDLPYPGATAGSGVFVGVRDLELPPGSTLVVRRPNSTVPELEIKAEGARTGPHWVPVMGSSAVVVEAIGNVSGTPWLRMQLEFGIAIPRGRPFSFRDPPRFEPLNTLSPSQYQETGKSVAAVYWVNGAQWRVCSGFMVSRHHFVSNHHCVATATDCESARVIFDYREQPDRVEPGRWFACKRVLDNTAVQAFDVGVLEIDVPAGITNPPVPLMISEVGLQQGQPLALLQHPFGWPMRLVREGCDVAKWPAKSPTEGSMADFGHRCDTADGSSGSPVLDKQGKVVGIHHWGFVEEPGYHDLNRAIRIEGPVFRFLSKLKEQ